MTDYYKILDCNLNDSSREIYKVFTEKVFPLHPDNRNQEYTDRKKFLELCKAYFVIRDMDQRAPYDLIYKDEYENKEIEYDEKEKRALLNNWDRIGRQYAIEYYEMSFNEFRKAIPKSMNIFEQFIYVLWTFTHAV